MSWSGLPLCIATIVALLCVSNLNPLHSSTVAARRTRRYSVLNQHGRHRYGGRLHTRYTSRQPRKGRLARAWDNLPGPCKVCCKLLVGGVAVAVVMNLYRYYDTPSTESPGSEPSQPAEDEDDHNGYQWSDPDFERENREREQQEAERERERQEQEREHEQEREQEEQARQERERNQREAGEEPKKAEGNMQFDEIMNPLCIQKDWLELPNKTERDYLANKAFKKFALKYHPDRCRGSKSYQTDCDTAFKRAGQQLEKLTDPANERGIFETKLLKNSWFFPGQRCDTPVAA